MNVFKRSAALIISLLIITTILAPSGVMGASIYGNSKTIIKLSVGSSKLIVNGQEIKIEKPYLSAKTTYIPLRAVLESIGAEVNWLGKGSINILFRNISVDINVGRTEFHRDQTAMKLSAPPETRNGSVMIPEDLLRQCFDADISGIGKPGESVITLKSDGALTDLSFLTGSINLPKAGNSYFGWSLNVPKGSRIASQSFNSKNIQFENVQHGISIDVKIDAGNGKSLEKYYGEILDNPLDTLKTELIDSNLKTDASPPYIELFYTDTYDEAVYHRIYINENYTYNLIITSFDESDPDVLKNDKYITGLMDSFKLDYKGNLADTTELSNVKFGLAEYSNYITSDSTGKKYYTWAMDVLPEWDILQSQNGNPYNTEFGASSREYASVELSLAKGETDTIKYGTGIKTFYNSNFNPAIYNLIKAEASSTAGYKTYNMVYDVKMGKNLYRYDERFLISGGLVFDLTFKAQADVFEKKKESYYKMLETFKPSTKDLSELLTEIGKYAFNNDKNRMGKDDKSVSYENKSSGWSFTLPGYWQKNSSPGQNPDSFYNPKTGAVIIVDSLAKKAVNAGKKDEELFEAMKTVVYLGLDPVKVETIQAKGRQIKSYKYRLVDDKSENYADIYYYIIEDDAYSYCFMSTIPDLSSSAANLKSMEDIWNSFTINDKSHDKQ